MAAARSLVLAILVAIALSSCTDARAKNPPDYAQLGMPLPDHRWTIREYVTAVNIVAKLPPQHLPRARETRSAAMFWRLVDPALYAPCNAAQVTFAERYAKCLPLITAYQQVQRAYIFADSQDETFSNELLYVMTFALGMITAMDEDLSDMAKTDPSAHAKVASGATMMIRSGLGLLSLNGRYDTGEARALLSRQVAKVFLAHDLPAGDRAEFLKVIRRMVQTDPNPAVRTELAPAAK